MNGKVYTTGQAARYLKVAPRTVSKWFDCGIIKGYRLPNSCDRRIPHEYLLKFMIGKGMDTRELKDDVKIKVLIVSVDIHLEAALQKAMAGNESFLVRTASNAFEAGIFTGQLKPDCLIVDFAIGGPKALEICRNLRCHSEYFEAMVFAFLPEGTVKSNFDTSSINEVYNRTVDVTQITERLIEIFAEAKGID